MAEPEAMVVDCGEGIRVAALDWGGEGPPLVLLHPNGFCAGLFDPIARRLAAEGRFRPVGVDLRGHGASSKPPPPDPYDYRLMAADVAAVLDALGISEVAVTGGSLGGGVAIHLDRAQPGRVRRLLLCEPIAHPVPEVPPDNPLVALTLARRVVWDSKEAMVAAYRTRSPLADLAPEALAAYVAWGTRPCDDGQVELACPPPVEAAIYHSPVARRGVAEAWEHLGRLTAPAVILAGDNSSLPRLMFEDQAARAGAPLVVVPGGHLALHEDTERGARLIAGHLGG